MLTLFTLTLINLLCFYFKNSMPDNLFEVSNHSAEVSALSYYFSSFLSLMSFYIGPWVFGAFFIFSLSYSFIFSKREKEVDLYLFLPLIGSVAGLAIAFFPTIVGEGLRFHVSEFISVAGLVVASSVFFFTFVFTTFEGSVSNIVETYKRIQHAIVNGYRKYQYNKSRTRMMISEKAVVAPVKQKIKGFLKGKAKENNSEQNITSETAVSEMPIKETKVEPKIEQAPIVEEELPSPTKSTAVPRGLKTQPTKEKVARREKREAVSQDDLIERISRKSMNTSQHNPTTEYFETIIYALEDKLNDFKISAKVVDILKGPVVDTFEVELGPGVKVSKIKNLTKDLSLALKGCPIRIVETMRGKTNIGVEVPRNPREIIFLADVLKTSEFEKMNYRLPIALGKNSFGEVTVADLAGMPHLLVAGTTGAGKSVFINTLLVSLIIKLPPEKLKLILIDPKQLELAIYSNLPHLALPVTSDAASAGIYLLWAIQEMERRYSILKDFGVRNIEGFNEKLKRASDEQLQKIRKHYDGLDQESYELPYIVIVFDEFADFILSREGKQIEQCICKLAAKARASGIHLVLATQRPSVDVITGLIKANFPTRISFKVSDSPSSRTILGAMGAEMLLGKGDMLYKHTTEMSRLHSAYIDENEIEELMEVFGTDEHEFDAAALEFVENGGDDPNLYSELGIEVGSAQTAMAGAKVSDPMYDEAVRFAMEHRKVSTSLLQRKLSIGYNRAAKIVDLMEERGVVGPAQGSKPRRVLGLSESPLD